MAACAAVRPSTVDELREVIAEAAHHRAKLAITGGGSKAAIGAPTDARRLDMTGFGGVIDYDPAELVLTVGVATHLAEVQALVAEHHQMLPFDPFDHGAVLGMPEGCATIGGVVAAGVAGSLRLSQGGARDHLLGFKAVSGRAESFVAGARVVKNVTGFDLSKLMAGSWGRLAALTEVTLKVLPRPEIRATRLVIGLTVDVAVRVMARALGSQAEVWAAAYLPDYHGRTVTALCVQGFAQSVDARCRMLDAQLADFGELDLFGDCASEAFWRAVTLLTPLPRAAPLWRIGLPPSQAPVLMRAIDGAWLLDWGGSLAWVATLAEADAVRAAARGVGGHATLVRAGADIRSAVPTFHPQPAGVAALEARVRRAFDPFGVFDTGRF
jgi:glycolate oxidase FAD binding subunit